MKRTTLLLVFLCLLAPQLVFASHSTNWECDHYNNCHTSIYIFSDTEDVAFKAKAYKVEFNEFFKAETELGSTLSRAIVDVVNFAKNIVSSGPDMKFQDAGGSTEEPNKHVWNVNYKKSYSGKTKPATDAIKKAFRHKGISFDEYPYYVEFRVMYRKIDTSMKDNGSAEHYAFKFEVDGHKKGYIEYFPWEEELHTLGYGYQNGKLSYPVMF